MAENPKPPEPYKQGRHYTIKTLRLDLESAIKGKTWLLLPEGFREQSCGKSYPLPSLRAELIKLAAIPIPPMKTDCGCLYLRRAVTRLRANQTKTGSALLDMGRRENAVRKSHDNYIQRMKKLGVEANAAVDDVRKEAALASASLTDLFALGRRGLKGQMEAHLNQEKWNGEGIDARAFRECFRMVTTAVKGLGLPDPQRKDAQEAVMGEVAASMRATQDAIALAPKSDDPDETKH